MIHTQGYLGHPQQEYLLRRLTLEEGSARGTRVIEVMTAHGLHLDILPDCGLDLGQAHYNGVNVSFLSKNGYDGPAARSPHEDEFLHTFPGGLLYTCGLRSTGGAHRDGAEWHPLHGRYHGLQAEQVCAYAENDTIIVRGVVRETALFGPCLSVQRMIRIPIHGASVTVEDTITNLGFSKEEFALVYHCNFGWPLLNKDAVLELPAERRTTPRTPFAATRLGLETTFTAPVPNEEESVFFHEGMIHAVSLRSPDTGIRAAMTWSDTLPILAEWRSMASGDYVLGLEPTNCYIMGRKQERENGTLPALAPGETFHTAVTISFDTI